MLLSALRCFYASLGSFAISAITSLLGAALTGPRPGRLSGALEVVAVAAGLAAVAGLVLGCVLLLQETRIAVRVVSEEAAMLRERFGLRDRPRQAWPQCSRRILFSGREHRGGRPPATNIQLILNVLTLRVRARLTPQ